MLRSWASVAVLVLVTFGCSDRPGRERECEPDCPEDAGPEPMDSMVVTGCARFEFYASGESCPASGCPSIMCECPEGFPRSLTACEADGCIIAANCIEVCAADSLGDALDCTETYTVLERPDAGPPIDGGCSTRVTCADVGAECGSISDGCGGTIPSCGSCSGSETCGGDGIPNRCGGGCTPLTCADVGAECGRVPDGCGGMTADCGSCIPPRTCGGGGVPNRCGASCTPFTCADVGAECGSISDGCGMTIPSCGTCTPPATCGGGGIANRCGTGCIPRRCSDVGAECGSIMDGCGGTIASCGTCTAPETCGGGGIANVCGRGCIPRSCAPGECGIVGDGCGGSITCPGCTAPETCGGGGTPGICGCRATTCMAAGAECGTIPDGCGGTATCPTCTAPETCGGSGLPNVCGCTPRTCADAGATCGMIDDGCGTMLDCGTCVAPATCGGGGTLNQCGCGILAPESSGPRSPTAAANNATFGSNPWSMTSNVFSSNDAWAVADVRSGGRASNYLVASGFGFAIPTTATINGIVVEVERNDGTPLGAITDARVRIVRAGAVLPDEKAMGGVAWPLLDGTVTYGAPGDLWGSTWTPADINDAAFGVAIAAQTMAAGGGQTARVDHIRVTVHYTPTCPVP